MAVVQSCGRGRARLRSARLRQAAALGGSGLGGSAGSRLGSHRRAAGLRRHRQWVSLGSATAGIKAVEAAQAQGTGHTGARQCRGLGARVCWGAGLAQGTRAQGGYEWCGMKMSGGPPFL